MNKKFSTLVAAFLVASTTATMAVVTPTNGDYVRVNRTHNYSGSSWADVNPYHYDLTVVDGKVAIAAPENTPSKASLWKVEEVKVNVGGTETSFYRLVNADGFVLKINKRTLEQPAKTDLPTDEYVDLFQTAVDGNADITTFICYVSSTPYYLVHNNESVIKAASAPTSSNPYLGFTNITVANTVVPAATLNSYFSDSFSFVGKKGDVIQTIEENPLLSKDLKAVSYNGNTYLRVSGNYNDGDDLVKFKKSKFVAVNGSVRNVPTLSVDGYGYTFTTVEGLELLDGGDKKIPAENAQFTIKYAPNKGYDLTNATDSLILTVNAKFADKDGKYTTSGATQVVVRPQMHIQNSKNVLTTYLAATEDGGAATVGSTQGTVKKTSEWVKITLGKASTAVALDYFAGKAWNVFSVNQSNKAIKYILHPEAYTLSGWWSDLENVLVNKPEGQWVIVGNKDTKKFTAYNRESGSSIDLGATIYTEGNDLYTINNTVYKIVEADALADARMGGYAHGVMFDKTALAQTAYRLGVMNDPSGSEAYVEAVGKDGNELQFNIKNEEGLAFYLIPGDTLAYGIGATNEITVKDYPSGDEDVDVFNAGSYKYTNAAKTDSLIRVVYILQDRVSKKYVNGSSLVLDKENASLYYLKEKADGRYVLVNAGNKFYEKKTAYGDYADAARFFLPNDLSKSVVNITTGKLIYTDLYSTGLADEFTFTKAENPKYAYILQPAKADNDTALVNINLNSTQNTDWMLSYNANNELVEGVPAGDSEVKEETSHIGGLPYADETFSLCIDTAYVLRENNAMPLYYIAKKGATRGDSLLMHPNSGHNCNHWMANDTVVGSYLFVMQDSLSSKKNAATYKYSYGGYNYTRLFFVDAKRTADQMIVLKADGKDGNKFNVSADNAKNYALFAFEVNPANEKEYAIYNPAANKYVAYLNGNVVMKNEPSYYTRSMQATGDVVTASDDVTISSVSVVAIDGAVVVKGAAGKKVTISNVLGQTIANTVIASDEVTIAAPAGVVVVAVDGEAAVKAIVK